MNRRTLAILILVIGIVLLSIVAIVYFFSQDDPQPPPAPPPISEEGDDLPVPPEPEPTAPAELVEVVVSLQTVPRGWQFTENELVIDMRVDVGPNAITNIEDAVGLYARTDIYQGATLTRDQLANDVTQVGLEEFGPASLIPSGFIASAVPLDRLSGVAYALSEGDYVDIMITFFFYQIDEEFQTYLQNSAVFFLEEVIQAAETEEEQEIVPELIILDQFGRFERLPNGDIAHIGPSELQRPIPVSMVLQNARVIQVGIFGPGDVPQPPTPTPTPDPDDPDAQPGDPGAVTPPEPPDTLLVALSPQQQLLLRYAVESNANISFALRGVNDTQLYAIENVDIDYFLRRFGIEEPRDFGFSVDKLIITPTPSANGE
jgi:Flp pilus assembly protein CpaB